MLRRSIVLAAFFMLTFLAGMLNWVLHNQLLVARRQKHGEIVQGFEARPVPVTLSALNNTVKIDWDGNRRLFVTSMSRSKVQLEDNVLAMKTETRVGTGNKVQSCIKLVVETILCGAIARCENLVSHKLNFYNVTYIDARGALALKLPASHRPFPHLNGTRNCRREFGSDFSTIYSQYIERERQVVVSKLLPVVSRVVLSYLGAAEPGVVFGKQCAAHISSPQTLIGHIRAGDIMDRSSKIVPRARASRGQPPLKYWIRAVEQAPFTRALLIAEDLSNPVASALHALGDTRIGGALYELTSDLPLKEVLSWLLCAQNVVMGRSTMSVLVGSSWNIRRLILPDAYCPRDVVPYIDLAVVWSLRVEAYESIALEWDSSAEKKLAMLTHAGVAREMQPCEEETPEMAQMVWREGSWRPRRLVFHRLLNQTQQPRLVHVVNQTQQPRLVHHVLNQTQQPRLVHRLLNQTQQPRLVHHVVTQTQQRSGAPTLAQAGAASPSRGEPRAKRVFPLAPAMATRGLRPATVQPPPPPPPLPPATRNLSLPAQSGRPAAVSRAGTAGGQPWTRLWDAKRGRWVHKTQLLNDALRAYRAALARHPLPLRNTSTSNGTRNESLRPT